MKRLITAITLTKVVFPEYCSPTSVSSISSFQNRALNQSSSLLKSAIMVRVRLGFGCGSGLLFTDRLPHWVGFQMIHAQLIQTMRDTAHAHSRSTRACAPCWRHAADVIGCFRYRCQIKHSYNSRPLKNII